MKSQIAHNRDYGGISAQLSALLQVLCKHRNKLVAVNGISVFVTGEAPVCVAVKRKAYVQPVFLHKRAQIFNMRRAAVLVDIRAVGLVGEEYAVCAKPRKKLLRSCGGAAVCAVKRRIQPVKAGIGALLYMLYVIGRRSSKVSYSANLCSLAQCDILRSVKNKLLNLLLNRVGKLEALARKQLYSVILNRIMRSRYHNARVRAVFIYEIRHSRRWHNVKHNRVRTHRGYSRCKRRLQNIGGNAGVLANQDFRARFAAFPG